MYATQVVSAHASCAYAAFVAVAHQLRHGSGLIIAAAVMQMGEHQVTPR